MSSKTMTLEQWRGFWEFMKTDLGWAIRNNHSECSVFQFIEWSLEEYLSSIESKKGEES